MKKADFIYLTGNKLTGGVPNYFVERNKNVYEYMPLLTFKRTNFNRFNKLYLFFLMCRDVSFNNFTDESSIPSHDCNRVTSNLVESFALGNKS
jgi:hypothetical protein